MARGWREKLEGGRSRPAELVRQGRKYGVQNSEKGVFIDESQEWRGLQVLAAATAEAMFRTRARLP